MKQSTPTTGPASAAGTSSGHPRPAAPVDPALLAYADDTQAAFLLHAPRRARALLWVVLAFIIIAILWAWQAPLEQVTRGQGKVIPSSQRQVVQNLEGDRQSHSHCRRRHSAGQSTLAAH
ncbi:type I secretion system membrane fusion protein LapC [Photobacterium aphoticum]|uniref:Type I secretion system membrane fusion protein LapC n=1 Tax=Photobacterium aphoticum TaxID=754436 RepID=A0A090QIX1_9GAMM|nr:type I secretion system membrane fusion protein LapC [Photobacterium aphoticum]